MTMHYLTKPLLILPSYTDSANAGICMLNAHSVTILQVIKWLITFIITFKQREWMFHPHSLLRIVQRSQIISSSCFNKLVSLIFPILILPKRPKQTKSKKRNGENIAKIIMTIKMTKNVQNYNSCRRHSLVTFNEATQILTASLMMVL